MKFIEDIHKYIDEESEYTPVTYFIKSFFIKVKVVKWKFKI